MTARIIPVVDLFAGPGGLSEGFSSVSTAGERFFDVRVSIEKDPKAYETLKLRSFFRAFPQGKAPDCYYDYLRGNISKHDLITRTAVRDEWSKAEQEARNATLGETSPEQIDSWIRSSIGYNEPWVLIGGPPCQAYSMVGRARMRGGDPHAFELDKRHFLYKEYLRILRKFQPAVFVMENVKGILSSRHKGALIFERIRDDLSRPDEDLEYEIRSFVSYSGQLKPTDFIIESEKYGIPQTRHRVILFGIRKDYSHRKHCPLRMNKPATVKDILSGMPHVRSRLSLKTRPKDSLGNLIEVLKGTRSLLSGWSNPRREDIEDLIDLATRQAVFVESDGGRFIPNTDWSDRNMSQELASMIRDPRLGGVCQHEARSHMPSDLHRYMFAACYTDVCGVSPTLGQFPLPLLPEHRNVDGSPRNAEVPFVDRFRVQRWNSPATTIMAHMAKDGHYFIHPDPSQCRSLTVREGARLQTFPDNYFFEGNKIDQYTQVGNAVPPHLAKQIAETVAEFLIVKQQPESDCASTARDREGLDDALEARQRCLCP